MARIIGVNWGAGQTFQPDEGKVVRPPICMAENCTFMSNELEAPSQITSRVLSVVFKLVMIYGSFSDTEINGLVYVVIARTYMVVLSVCVVASIFFIGNHLKKHSGTIAAALTAVFPPFIHAAHCAENDTFVALCICIGILCAFHYLEENRNYKWLSLMSLITVFATFDKWHGIVMCSIIAIAICLKQFKHKNYMIILLHGAFSVFVIVVSTILLVPNLIVNCDDIIETLIHLTNDYVDDQNATFMQNIYAYVIWFFSHMGIMSIIFLIAGVIHAIKEKQIEFILLLIGIAEIFGICIQDRHYIRWGYPFYVVLIIMIGVGVVHVYENSNRIYKKIFFGSSIALIGLNLLAGTALLDIMFANSQLDTRVASEKWCQDRGISQFDCIYDHYTCWSPGGIVTRYSGRYGLSVNEAIQKIDQNIMINHIGRLYAVALPNENMKYMIKQGGGMESAYFKVDCVFNDNGFGDFGNVPYKIFEPSRILFCLNKCMGILKKRCCLGMILLFMILERFHHMRGANILIMIRR
ncbi:MAG: glycosyltransferase family 39 protein [Lachnospiraceae bacterium]|nr:glycosyltransferase family 39 protein [Lachnospiraceae bacterium]